MAKRRNVRSSPARKTSSMRSAPRPHDDMGAPEPGIAIRAGDTSSPRVVTARRRGPRTAGGKKMNPGALAQAEHGALEGLRERTEEGHLKAGRTPPSQQSDSRRSGAVRIAIDDSIRNVIAPATEDEKLLQSGKAGGKDFTRTDPWRVMRIMGEIIEGFDTLADIDRGVAIFGSARTG